MKTLLDVALEKFFGLICGIVFLAIVLMGMQISTNFGVAFSKQTIYMGWIMVFVWLSLITLLVAFHSFKNQSDEE